MFAPAISRSRQDPRGEYLIAINRLSPFHNRSSYTNGCVTSREASSVYTGRSYRNQNWNFQWSSEQHHVPVNSKRGHQVRTTTRAPTDEQAWSLSLSPTPSPSLSCSFPSVSYTFPISLLGPRAWHQGRVDGRVTRPPLRLYTCFACCVSRWRSGIDEAVGESLRTLSLTPIRIAQSLSASISPSSA